MLIPLECLYYLNINKVYKFFGLSKWSYSISTQSKTGKMETLSTIRVKKLLQFHRENLGFCFTLLLQKKMELYRKLLFKIITINIIVNNKRNNKYKMCIIMFSSRCIWKPKWKRNCFEETANFNTFPEQRNYLLNNKIWNLSPWNKMYNLHCER